MVRMNSKKAMRTAARAADWERHAETGRVPIGGRDGRREVLSVLQFGLRRNPEGGLFVFERVHTLLSASVSGSRCFRSELSEHRERGLRRADSPTGGIPHRRK